MAADQPYQEKKPKRYRLCLVWTDVKGIRVTLKQHLFVPMLTEAQLKII